MSISQCCIDTNMSTSDKICKDGASKSNLSDDVCEMNDKLQSMSTVDNEDSISICANCGKEGSDNMNTCNKCKQVKYCNAACKKKHRSKHKKACERRVAELHDEALFKEPPSLFGDCPICFERLPTLSTGRTFMTCCGKRICSGCVCAPVYDNKGNEVTKKVCPFCRTPWPYTDEEDSKRVKKRVELNDPIAMFDLGCCYQNGRDGYPQNYTKALELYHRAAELGQNQAFCSIGYAYDIGQGVKVDEKKANHYYELGAMRGDVYARRNLGHNEIQAGNFDRALKHYMIAAGGGYSDSLNEIKKLYSHGIATKDDYTKALQSYQEYLRKIKSKQRDEAAAAREDRRYY